jgi:cell division protein FtsW
MRIRSSTGRPDYAIALVLLALIIFGLAMLASASSYLGETKFGDSYYYLKHQLLYGFGVGAAGFIIAYFVNYRFYRKWALILVLFSIVLVFLVFTPLGVKSGGAERWLKIGPLTFQPAELLRITFILYLAAWLSGNKDRSKSFLSGFLPFLIIAGAVGFLLLKQPATSMTMVLIGSGLIVYFASGARLSYIAGFFLLGLIILMLVIYWTPYRLNRLINFLNPESDPLRGGYHLNQALIAIGSGELGGVGYGQSTTKLKFLPEPIGDSIFAVIAEELGFIGSVFTVGLFAFLVLKIMLLSKKVSDNFGKLVLVGFGSMIVIQTFFHIGAISGLLPFTGTLLPFVSYGGTSLAVFMTMGGIILNISKYT